MNKQAKIHAVAVSILASIALAAPVASYLANAPQDRPVPTFEAVAPKAVQAAPEPTEQVVTLDALMIVGRAARAPKAAPKAAATQRCHDHQLEQGGSPDAPTVRVCVPAS